MQLIRYKTLLGAFALMLVVLSGCKPLKPDTDKTYLKGSDIYCLETKTHNVYCSWHQKYLKEFTHNKKKFGQKASQEICYANFITKRYGCFGINELIPYAKKQHNNISAPSSEPVFPIPSDNEPSDVFGELISEETPDRDQFITCLEEKGFIFQKGSQFASLEDVQHWQKKCGSTPAGGHETEGDDSQVRDSMVSASADRDQRVDNTIANGDKFVEAACKDGKNDWLLPQNPIALCFASVACIEAIIGAAAVVGSAIVGAGAVIGGAVIAGVVADDAVDATERATRMTALENSCADGNQWACDQRDCYLGDAQACARVDANEYDDPAPEPEPEPEPDEPMPCGDADDEDCDTEPDPTPLPCGDDPDCEEDSTPTPDPDQEPAPGGSDDGSSLLPPGGSGSCEAIAGRWAMIKGYCESVQWQGDFCDSVMDMFSPRNCADDENSTPTPGSDETCSQTMTSREHQEAVCRRRGGLILTGDPNSTDRCDFGNAEVPAMDLCSNPHIQWDRDRGCIGDMPQP